MFSKNDCTLWIVMISANQCQSNDFHYPWKTRTLIHILWLNHNGNMIAAKNWKHLSRWFLWEGLNEYKETSGSLFFSNQVWTNLFLSLLSKDLSVLKGPKTWQISLNVCLFLTNTSLAQHCRMGCKDQSLEAKSSSCGFWFLFPRYRSVSNFWEQPPACHQNDKTRVKFSRLCILYFCTNTI